MKQKLMLPNYSMFILPALSSKFPSEYTACNRIKINVEMVNVARSNVMEQNCIVFHPRSIQLQCYNIH